MKYPVDLSRMATGQASASRTSSNPTEWFDGEATTLCSAPVIPSGTPKVTSDVLERTSGRIIRGTERARGFHSNEVGWYMGASADGIISGFACFGGES